MITSSKQQGFTLLELMIVVAIVGILAGIAYPSYQDSIRKTRRADAITILSATSLAQERFFATNGRYAETLSLVGMTSSGGTFYSDAGYYAVTVVGATTTYTLTATPVAGTSQASDASCTTLTINQLGAQGATGSATSDCWTN